MGLRQSTLSQSTLSRAMLAEWELSASQPCISNSHNAVEQANIEMQFEARAGFPNVIGAINCTHSVIKSPSHDEFVYRQETF